MNVRYRAFKNIFTAVCCLSATVFLSQACLMESYHTGGIQDLASNGNFSETAPPNGGIFTAADLQKFDSGVQIYNTNCAACHGPVESSKKRGYSYTDINAATGPGSFVPQMVRINLTDQQISDVAYALNQNRQAILDGINSSGGSGPSYVDVFKKRIVLLTADQYVNTLFPHFSGLSKTQGLQLISQQTIPLQTSTPTAYRYSTVTYSRSFGSTDMPNFWDISKSVADYTANSLNYGQLGCSGNINQNCLDNIINAYGERAYRRPLTTKERTDARNLAGQFSSLQKQEQVSIVLQAFLLSPHFIFRTELGSGSLNTEETLTEFEKASLISYSVADMPPDNTLMNDARNGSLDVATVKQHAKRLMAANPGQPNIVRFFNEYFHYEHNDPQKTDPNFNIDLLAQDSDKVIEHLARNHTSGDLFGQLMNSSLVYMTPTTSSYYGRSPSSIPNSGSIINLSGERRGIMTHPAWLASFSTADRNNPVGRGLHIRENLLCGTIPDAPIVNFDSQANPNLTLREKFVAHTSVQSCQNCHSQMDNLGFPFEQFDHFGNFRVTELGRPVDTTGTIDGSSDVDGAVSDPFEMITKLAQSQTVRSCLAKNVIQYMSGETALPNDNTLTNVFGSSPNYSNIAFDEMNSQIMSYIATRRRGTTTSQSAN